MDRIICVAGPTASGKTRLAVDLAEHYGGEVVSCDSMQIYRGMDIGTAKPTPEEMRGVPHHMLDFLDPNEDYSVGRYVEEADAVLQRLLAEKKTVIVCGGTGLYMDSLIAGRTFAAAPETGKREELRALADREGIGAVLELLRKADPERAEKLSPRDEKRIIRAAEICLETGMTATEHDAMTRMQPDKYEPLWLGLNYLDRAVLYERINLRVDEMLRSGLEAELESLLAAGIREDATAMQAIGYKELLAARRGEESFGTAVEKLKQGTRRYAKRQLSWFRRNEKIHWLYPDGMPDYGSLLREAIRLADEAFEGKEDKNV